MKDKTKKWLAIAGLLAVCAVLVFGISRVLYHEPDREAQAVERESEETELFVETETPEPVQAESTEAETEEPLVIETETGTSVNDREQEIQETPEKTEAEKPSEPPALSEGTATDQPDTPPSYEEEKQEEPAPAENQTPKTGDTKDGMVYVEGKTISGLLKPRTGDVLYRGKSIKGVRAHKIVEAGLAQVPEGRHVFLHMTVEENLDMGAYTQPASTIAPNKEKVFELFPRLKERRKQLAGTMSGGEQQMLAMGRALMSNASMLMLDEPSMGLSPLLVQEIFDIIRDIHKEGMTILLVEQNAQMALSVADRAYVLETGRVVMAGTGAELLTNERVRSAYLGG